MLMRQVLLFLSRRRELERFLRHHSIARQTVRRLIAGETRAEALEVARLLNAGGFKVTLEYLGEEITETQQAQAAAEEYAGAVEEAAAKGLDTGISVKPTHLGLRIGEGIALDHLRMIAHRAAAVDRFVRVDTEGADLTEKTLELVRRVHTETANIGAVIQARLRRSSADLELLNRERVPVRLVKGSYLDSGAAAFNNPEDVDLYYMRLLESLLREGIRPAVATHDEKLIEYAIDMAFIFSRTPGEYEFQLLYGVNPELQRKLLREGYRVRIYLPYGEDWYGYSMRRLAERPANLWALLRKQDERTKF